MQVAVGSGAHVMARHRIIRCDAGRYHRVAGLPQSRQRLHRSNRGTEDEKREGSTQTGGFGLAVKSDGLPVRMQADPAVEADTSRLRLLLEGTAAVPFAGGASQWRYAARQVGLLKPRAWPDAGELADWGEISPAIRPRLQVIPKPTRASPGRLLNFRRRRRG